MFTHLKLCPANATHNFMWENITNIIVFFKILYLQ